MNSPTRASGSPLRLGIVGAGDWARHMHVPALQRLREAGRVCCVGVCDRDRSRAGEVGHLVGAPAFSDLEALLREALPEAVALLVSPPSMAELIRSVAEVRMPFLCEKPPAPDTATHEQLIRQVGNLPHVVGYNRRFAPYLQRAIVWMEGHPRQLVRALFLRCRRYDADFSTTAVHPLDTVLWLAQDELAEGRLEFFRSGQVRNAFLSGWTPGGTRIEVTLCPDTGLAWEHYEVVGATRAARVAFPQHDMTDYPGGVELFEEKRRVAALSPHDFDVPPEAREVLIGIVGEYEALIAAIREGKPSPATLSSTVAVRQLADAWKMPGDRVTLIWRDGRWEGREG